MLTNEQVIDRIIDLLPEVDNRNQLAVYLTEKYGVTISRQQVNQFQTTSAMTITHLLLREFLEQIDQTSK